MDVLFVLVGLVLLVFGGEWLLVGAVGFSLKLNIPKAVVGLTVVSLATSAPELIVSINSALAGKPDLAVGNVIGSNIANIALVLSVTILLANIRVQDKFFSLDWPILMVVSGLLYFVIFRDHEISRWEGGIFVVLLLAYFPILLKYRKEEEEIDEVEADVVHKPVWQLLAFLILGGVALWVGSELLVKGAVNLASLLGVSEAVIGLSVVAVGTSIPELAASIIAIVRGHKSIGLGNIVGSNIFNILSVLGITALIQPIAVADNFVNDDIFWMLGFSLAVLILALTPKFKVLSKIEGTILLLVYIFYVYRMTIGI